MFLIPKAARSWNISVLYGGGGARRSYVETWSQGLIGNKVNYYILVNYTNQQSARGLLDEVKVSLPRHNDDNVCFKAGCWCTYSTIKH